MYGPGCNDHCQCHPTNAKNETCDPQTGHCTCHAGFESRNCSKGEKCELYHLITYFVNNNNVNEEIPKVTFDVRQDKTNKPNG